MDPQSPKLEPPEELLRAFSQRDLIVCVGPQPSVEAGLTEMRELALVLVDGVSQRQPELDVTELRSRIDAGQIAEVLQIVERHMGDAFARECQARLGDDELEPPPILRALARLRSRLRAVYTVRLDRLVERAFGGRWPTFATPRPDLAQRRNVVFKLFGALETPSTWVLTQAQVQRELLPGAAGHEAFAAAYRAHQMLFIGFSASDPELQTLLDMTPASAPGHGPGHFIALRECTATERELLEGAGLVVIECEPDALLDRLGQTLSEETLLEPIVVTPPSLGNRLSGGLAWGIVAGVLLIVVAMFVIAMNGRDIEGKGATAANVIEDDKASIRADADADSSAPELATSSGGPGEGTSATGTSTAAVDDETTTGIGFSTSDDPSGSESSGAPPPAPRARTTCYVTLDGRTLGTRRPRDRECQRYQTAKKIPGCSKIFRCR